MNITPKKTLREHQQTVTAAAAEEISKKRLEAGQIRARSLALVLGHGCGYCWGRQDIRTGPKGESILVCPILTETEAGIDVRPEVVTAAKGCKIPGLYARVGAGERQDITSEEVLKLVPRIGEAGEKETLRQVDPDAALQAAAVIEGEGG